MKELPPEELEDDAQRTVVNAIDGRRSLAELVLESRSSSFNVASTIYHLTREGYVKLTDPTLVAGAGAGSRGGARAVRRLHARTTRSCR